ncbi:MAG: hypothetical protein OHK006_03140 [Thermodesulfovibrionales bacterium]
MLALLTALCLPAPARAAAGVPAVPQETQAVFDRYAGRIVKIHIMETGSGAKAELGTGFFVSAEGHVMTNYHVVARLVLHRDRYRAEIVDHSGDRHPISVLGVDVINDLAVVKADLAGQPFFRLAPAGLKQGMRLYSLGYPHDIGITIVEGTYNGLIRTALYPKIHFTGSLNPGMSGGPAITASGDVAGVNVSTAGEQVGFLVPAEAAAALMAKMAAAGAAGKPGSLLDDVRSQLLGHQETYFSDTLMAAGETVRLGDFQLPSQPAPFFKCWGDAESSDEKTFRVTEHQCSTDDFVYISGGHRSGVIELTHRLIEGNGLNRFQFSRLYTDFFRKQEELVEGKEEDLTRFSCETAVVNQDRLRMKTVFCMRGYRKLAGLYDVVLKAAVLGRAHDGLVTTLILSGVSFDKALRLSRNFLEAVRWAK